MKEELKETLKEMIKNGEIKFQLDYQSLWNQIHLMITIDDEEIVNTSIQLELDREYYE